MAKKTFRARQLTKEISGLGIPTLPASNDHTDGTWTATDIYGRELVIVKNNGVVQLYTRDPETDEIFPIASADVWTLINTTKYTATPASTTTITTTEDLSNILIAGDILKITLTDSGVQYNVIEDVTSTTITVSGVPLDNDITAIRYENGNRARLNSLIVEMDNENIYQFGVARPDRSASAGAAAASAGTYGTDVFYNLGLKLSKGAYLVDARGTVEDAGSSATALELGVGFSNQAGYACNITFTSALEAGNKPTSINRTYYRVLVAENNLDKVDIVTNAGNNDASQAILHLQFFIDISE